MHYQYKVHTEDGKARSSFVAFPSREPVFPNRDPAPKRRTAATAHEDVAIFAEVDGELRRGARGVMILSRCRNGGARPNLRQNGKAA